MFSMGTTENKMSNSDNMLNILTLQRNYNALEFLKTIKDFRLKQKELWENIYKNKTILKYLDQLL